MNLSAPTTPVFIIAVVIALLALIVHYAGAAIPLVSGHTFEILLAGFVVLMLKNV